MTTKKHELIATTEGPGVELALDKMPAAGALGQLTVLAIMENETRDNNSRLNDQLNRPFLIRLILSKQITFPDRLSYNFTRNDGASYVTMADGATALSVRTASGAFEVELNDRQELSLVHVLPFDFQQVLSKDEGNAIAVASSLLSGGTAQDAKKFWGNIVGRARETRLGSGTLDMAALRRWLRPRFSLKDLPDYEPSWARLRALSAETESIIQTALPSGASLDFRPECDRLLTELGAELCLEVYGDLGTGKSALVKVLLDTHFPDSDADLACAGTS